MSSRLENAELVGTVRGYRFYEDPEHGDERPLIAVNQQGWVMGWQFWDKPSAAEVEYLETQAKEAIV